MTITLELPEDTLAALRADAGTQGRPVEDVAAERLAAFYVDADNEWAAVEEAFRELEAGQGKPFVDYVQEFSDRFETRYGTKGSRVSHCLIETVL